VFPFVEKGDLNSLINSNRENGKVVSELEVENLIL